jgi:hypothetical protein
MHNEEVHNLYFSLNIIRISKATRRRGIGHAKERRWVNKGLYKHNAKKTDYYDDPEECKEAILKLIFWIYDCEEGGGGVDWINVPHDGD